MDNSYFHSIFKPERGSWFNPVVGIYCWVIVITKLSGLKNVNILLSLSQIGFLFVFILCCDLWSTRSFRLAQSGITGSFIWLYIWYLRREQLKSLLLKELYFNLHVMTSHVLPMYQDEEIQISFRMSQASKTSIPKERTSGQNHTVFYDVVLEIKQCQLCLILFIQAATKLHSASRDEVGPP